jgi:integrase
LDSKLRACDVVALRLPDIMAAGALRSRAIVIQQKTGRPVQFEITDQARRSIADWLKVRSGEPDGWLFPSRMIDGAHLTTRQYTRLLKRWIELIGLEPAAYGTHSLRRTKVAMLYRKTGNLRACQLLLGHTKLESTVRYLGVELDDALALSEGLEI